MAKQQQNRRLLILALLVVAAFAGLGYRLVDLQVVRHEELTAIAQQNTQREFRLEPRRGDIVDTRGNLLATSIFVKTVDADPALIGEHYPEMARVLAPLLKLDEASLADRLKPRVIRMNTNGEPVFDRHVVLKHKVRVEEWQQITNVLAHQSFGFTTTKGTNKLALLTLQRKAIFTEEDQLRVYPNQTLAAHVLGFVGQSDLGEMNGVEGIERVCDSKLRGVRGWRRTEIAGGRELVPMREQEVQPRDGLNVVLTIDSVIQHMLESALAEGMEKHTPISICGIVIRPRTGEILAMATLPNYDPNQPGIASPDARRNRVIADVMEPGSTFKIVVVSGALNDQIVRLDDSFDCEHGHFPYAGHILHDHESYGVLSVKNIITKSSNIGAAKIGIKMGEDRLADYIQAYGFGSRSGVLLPGEVPGIVHSVKNWSKVSVAQIPMGQGIAVTRLQMAMTMCAIANRGWLVRPMIVSRLEDEDGNVVAQYAPQRIRQVVSEPAAKLMVEALKTVVSADGTAPKAALEHYTVAGKTGTAQKAIAGGYSSDKFFASFVGFFPADDPELCISIVMDEPKDGHYGGQVAGPLFKEVAERAANYLNLRPDITTPTDTVAQQETPATRTVMAR
jgi:cell division protein FtsI/penicillin-binding protein 2